MPRQLTFDLPARPALGRDDFFLSEANKIAVAMIEGWRDWPARKLLLIGDAGAGKTHLAHVWAAEAGAVVLTAGQDFRPSPGQCVAVEDVDRIVGNAAAEEALFHLHNQVLAHDGRLLMTARSAPMHWALSLPDLASRLQGTPLTRIEAPDDALLAAVLVKQFADRQISVTPTLIQYLLPRIDRSFAAVRATVEALDQAALAQGKPITRTLAGQLLDKPGTPGA